MCQCCNCASTGNHSGGPLCDMLCDTRVAFSPNISDHYCLAVGAVWCRCLGGRSGRSIIKSLDFYLGTLLKVVLCLKGYFRRALSCGMTIWGHPAQHRWGMAYEVIHDIAQTVLPETLIPFWTARQRLDPAADVAGALEGGAQVPGLHVVLRAAHRCGDASRTSIRV
jgi:hypothetical protein